MTPSSFPSNIPDMTINAKCTALCKIIFSCVFQVMKFMTKQKTFVMNPTGSTVTKTME